MPESDVPEFYVDQFRTNVNPYGAAITFGLASPHPTTGQAQVNDTVLIRMSLEHLKVMAVILKKQLKAYEEQTQATVNIPRAVLNQLGLSPEDW
jgi:hypothetical protein